LALGIRQAIERRGRFVRDGGLEGLVFNDCFSPRPTGKIEVY
jgi:hypothetical protein